MRVAVFGPNLTDQSKGTFVVHHADCQACAKLIDEERLDLDVDSIKELITTLYPEDDFGYNSEEPAELRLYRADIHLFHCAHGLSY